MALVKKLTKIGNSWGIILSSETLQLAGMKPNSECEVEVCEEGVLLRPHIRLHAKDKKVMEAMGRFIKKYQHTLKKLA